MANANIFSKIGTIVDDLTAQLTTAAVSPQVEAIKEIFVTYITLWVLARGYMILAGKTDEPIKGLIFDAAIKITIWTVVFSPHWIELISHAIDELNSWASGNISLYVRLDELLDSSLMLANKLLNEDSGVLNIPLIGALAAAMVIFGFIIFSVPAILITITTSVTLKILIMLSPIMIFTLMFSWFKQIFSKWIELVINNTLTVLLVGVLLNALNGKYKDVVDTANAHISNTDLLYTGASVFIVSLVIAWIVLMAKGVAAQLTTVSIEHLPGSAAREGKQLGSSAKNAITKTMGGISSVSMSAANITARGLRRTRR